MFKLTIFFNKTNFLLFSNVNNVNLYHIQSFSGTVIQCFKQNVTSKVPRNILKVETIHVLQELLQVNKASATKIANNYKKLITTPRKLLKENYDLCISQGLSNETILSCPEILSQADLVQKFLILSQLPKSDINDNVGLLKATKSELQAIVDLFKEDTNRVIYFAGLLKVLPLEMSEHIIKKKFLRKINLDRAKESIHLLKEHGVSSDEILNDLWALNYTKQTIEKRINFVKENNLEKIKTWMIRAQPNILLNYIKIRSDNKSILGNNSLSEYISNKLICPIEHANYIITRLPALKTKSVKKMDEIIDYLYEQGFKPIQICTSPKILLHSVETMKKRIQELQQCGVCVDNLNLLTKSQKQFATYYSRLERNKKKLKGAE